MEDWTATLPVRRRHPGRIALIVVGAVVGVCCISSGTAALVRSAMTANARADSRPQTEVQGAAPTRPGLGQAVRDGQFEFVVRSVNCGQPTIDNGWLHAEAKGQFCVAELTVTNIGTEPRNFGDGLQRATGASGEHYAADTGAGVVANGNGQAVWDVINPGITVTAKIVYDIPAGATITSLELHDGALSRGATVTLST
jgi:Domain of unknown function (DUF4352)